MRQEYTSEWLDEDEAAPGTHFLITRMPEMPPRSITPDELEFSELGRPKNGSNIGAWVCAVFWVVVILLATAAPQ